MDTFKDFLLNLLSYPFTWGLLLGLLVAGFTWKAARTARSNAKREIKHLDAELTTLKAHLQTQLTIVASGNEALQTELENLRSQNEILRVNNAALQQKPGRADQRTLQAYDMAVRTMREQAPGFAPAWENALRQAEDEQRLADSGLKKLVHRVFPRLAGKNSIIARNDSSSNE